MRSFFILFFLTATLIHAKDRPPLFDVEISVRGLVCPSCAIGLKKIFSKNSKVKSLKMDYKQGNLFLDYWNVEIHPSKIKKMVKDSGYEVSSIKWLKKKLPNRYNKP
jgi:cation transport ATPase